MYFPASRHGEQAYSIGEPAACDNCLTEAERGSDRTCNGAECGWSGTVHVPDADPRRLESKRRTRAPRARIAPLDPVLNPKFRIAAPKIGGASRQGPARTP